MDEFMYIEHKKHGVYELRMSNLQHVEFWRASECNSIVHIVSIFKSTLPYLVISCHKLHF